MKQYPFIFFGTPRFAYFVLRDLVAGGLVPLAVVCNPDRPVGRKKELTPPPVKTFAHEHGIPVIQDEDPAQLTSLLSSLSPSFGVVAAYSRILPASLIQLFPKGIIGVHPSLLPAYRGASPIQQAILEGVRETGVTLYLIDEKVDHGDILSSLSYPVSGEDTYLVLEEKLAGLGASLMLRTVPGYMDGSLKPKEQNHAKATFTKKFRTEDGFVDLRTDDPLLVYRTIKALTPEPGVYYMDGGKRIKIQEAVLREGKVLLTRIVEEGKKPREVRMEL